MADAAVVEWRNRLGVPENPFPKLLFTKALRSLLQRHTYRVAEYCDGIIVPAQDIADFLVSHIGMQSEKVAVVPHGIPDTFVSQLPLPMTPERARKILYVGQYSFIKGPHILARILGRVLEQNPDIGTTWVCSAEHHATVRSLIGRPMASRVNLLDWMPQEDLVDVYDSHGIFVFSSFYEGAAKACLEAMARGLCVVASRVGGIQDYIQHGKSGMLVDVGDTNGFVRELLQVTGDLDLMQCMSLEARNRAIGFTWRNCAEKATAFYQDLLARKRARFS